MRLKSIVTLLAAMVLLGSIASAQSKGDIVLKRIKKDLVKVVGNKLVYDRVVLFSAKGNESKERVQIKLHAEAPKSGLISRDYFVTCVMELFTFGLLKEGKVKEIDEPIGDVDREISLVLTSQGLQVSDRNASVQKTERTTFTWEQFEN